MNKKLVRVVFVTLIIVVTIVDVAPANVQTVVDAPKPQGYSNPIDG